MKRNINALGATLVSLGLFGILTYIGLILGLIGISVYGLYLAFNASIALGIITLFFEPSPLVFGLVMLMTGTNLPFEIMKWFQTLN